MDKVSTVTSSVRWWSRCCLFLSLLLLAAIRGPAQGLAIGGRYRSEDTSSGHQQQQQQQDDEVDLENSETLRIRLVRSLGLTRMPDLSQGPIPKEVMDEAYETYRRNVRETERRRHQLMTQTQYQDGDHEDDTFVVTFHSQGANSPTDVIFPEWTTQSGNDSGTWFYFNVDLTNHSENVNDVEVVHASIQTLRGDKVWWWWSSSSYHDRLDGQWELLSSADDADVEEDEDDEYDENSIHRKWDASEAVRTWVQSPATINRGLVLVQRDFDSSHVTTDGDLRLEVTLSRRMDSVRRSKRSTPHDLLKEPAWTGKTDCRKGTRHNYCCRKSLTVTAEQLGLGDIIIEPKKFNFYHCRGKCPHKYNPASTHAILQSLIYRTYKKGGKVCCAPSKLGDLEVLHLDEAGKNPVHSQWKNAVVLECACS